MNEQSNAKKQMDQLIGLWTFGNAFIIYGQIWCRNKWGIHLFSGYKI